MCIKEIPHVQVIGIYILVLIYLVDFPEAPEGRVILGVQIGGGIEQKGIKSLSDCVKRCANTGIGIPATSNTMLLVQKCFGIDYDFGTHK